jgi:tRNA A-37 threonylcarbamoyl transferase component Bud32
MSSAKDMSEFPFQLSIKSSSSNNKEESLSCIALLRAIPERRQIYDALWNDKNVIVKVFSHKISARHHLNREWRGLNKLQQRGLTCPEPLFCGKTEDGRWAVVTDKIVGSSTVLDILNETTNKSEKENLLIQICKELARQHNKGVLQKDLHLGNFLLADDKIYVLDPGQMRFYQHELSRKKSISQLALLVRYLPVSEIEFAEVLCKEYFKERNWKFGSPDNTILQKQLILHKKNGIRRGLRKCLRTSKRIVQIKTERYFAIFDRNFCREDEQLNFLDRIDSLMDKGQILKNGNTCYVSRLMWNGKDVVVKRYNHKGFIHSLRHTIKGSRARRAWIHAHRLGMLEIATPKPLAYIERRRGRLVWKSYLVTEYVQGQEFCYFLEDKSISQEEHSIVAHQVIDLLDKIGKYKISHGDLKHSNILITENGPTITDLDGMKVHKFHWAYKARRNKDIARFLSGMSGGSVDFGHLKTP